MVLRLTLRTQGSDSPARERSAAGGGPQLAGSRTASTRAGPAGAQRPTGDGRARQPRAEARGRGRPPGTVRKAERPTHAKRPNLVTVTDRNKGKEDGLAL